MELNETLKFLRKTRGLTQQECADNLGVNLSSYQKYERSAGTVTPSIEALIKIADYYDISLDFLLGRNSNEDEHSTIEKFTSEFNMSALEKKIIEGYVNLPQNMRTDLMEFLHRSVTEVMEEEKAKQNRKYIQLSFADYPVSAGFGDMLEDYEQWDKRSVLLTDKSSHADFIIRVDGDSMEPKYHDNDYILVKQQDAVDVGQIGVFALNGKGYMKKFGGDRLISLNNDYDDIPLDTGSEFRCFGLVLGTAEFEE